LEGNKKVPVPEEYWEYRLVRTFGWSKAQIDEAPAHWLDWMMAIADTEAAVRGR
jgi:hypothetical protein